MSREPELKITRRKLPHWTLEGAIYFVTFRVLTGVLTDEEMAITYEHIKKGNSRFYLLIALVVMPDHVHFFAMPGAEGAKSLSGFVAAWKRWTVGGDP